MPPRAMWTGQLRLSLVSFGVRMYAATESAKKVSMNQLHEDCHQRLKQQLVCPVHGPVNRDEIVKGYEYEKDTYVTITAEDLEAIRLQSSKTIELIQFVKVEEIDPLYVDAPYYLGPDGPVAEDAFRVIREAMKRSGRVGIGKVVMRGREQVVAVGVSGKGFLLSTLRYASEVRASDQVFKELQDGAVEEEQVRLAQSIIDGKAAAFEPEQFTDHYQEAFFEIVKAKIEGEAPIRVEEEDAPSTYNFMDALRQSVQEKDGGAAAAKPAAKSGGNGKKKSAGKKKTAKSAPKKPAAKSVTSKKKKAATKKRA